MFVALAGNHTLCSVSTTAGAITTVHTVTMFLSHALLIQLKELHWLEEEIHGLDVLKCFMVISGEQCVLVDSLT